MTAISQTRRHVSVSEVSVEASSSTLQRSVVQQEEHLSTSTFSPHAPHFCTQDALQPLTMKVNLPITSWRYTWRDEGPERNSVLYLTGKTAVFGERELMCHPDGERELMCHPDGERELMCHPDSERKLMMCHPDGERELKCHPGGERELMCHPDGERELMCHPGGGKGTDESP